jgi:hypothetical protein
MEIVGEFYCLLVCFTAIWFISWPFGIFQYNFSHFGMLYKEKSGNTGWF